MERRVVKQYIGSFFDLFAELLEAFHNKIKYLKVPTYVFEIVLCFILFFVCKLGRTSTSFFVIESSKMM